MPADLALDANGAPGIAYYLTSAAPTTPESYNTTLAFWRPNDGSVVKIADSQNLPSDTSSVSLTYQGTRPRVAYHLKREAQGQKDLWFSANADQIARK